MLLVCAVNGHGGPIQSLATVLRHLPDGIQLTLASQLSGQERERSAVEELVGDGLFLPRPRGRLFLQAQLLLLRRWRWVRKSVDVIHANGLTEAAVVLPVAIVTGVPVVVWIHNWERPRPYGLLEPIIRIVARRWRWMAVSSLAAAQVRGVKTVLVENPVDSTAVSSERTASETLRVLYFAGSDRPHKGFDLLPQIISAVACDDVEWLIYTSPPYTSTDQRCAIAWDQLLGPLAKKVKIFGRVANVADAYKNADVVIAPSRNESFNRVIAEAIANGLPVIASDIEPHRQLLESTGAGLLFEIHEPAGAARHIERLRRDREFYDLLRTQASSNSHRFSPEGITDNVLSTWVAAIVDGRDRKQCASGLSPLLAPEGRMRDNSK